MANINQKALGGGKHLEVTLKSSSYLKIKSVAMCGSEVYKSFLSRDRDRAVVKCAEFSRTPAYRGSDALKGYSVLGVMVWNDQVKPVKCMQIF